MVLVVYGAVIIGQTHIQIGSNEAQTLSVIIFRTDQKSIYYINFNGLTA